MTVKLDDEAGAAGLIFRHDGEKHYGFYPTGGKLRLTRFDGADVFSWKILARRGRARTTSRATGTRSGCGSRRTASKCFVNDQLAIESNDAEWADGQVGLAKFRDDEGGVQGLPRRAEPGRDAGRREGGPEADREQGGPPDLVGKLAKERASTDVIRDPRRGAGEAGGEAQGAGGARCISSACTTSCSKSPR